MKDSPVAELLCATGVTTRIVGPDTVVDVEGVLMGEIAGTVKAARGVAEEEIVGELDARLTKWGGILRPQTPVNKVRSRNRFCILNKGVLDIF